MATGTIFLRPSETSSAAGLRAKTGADVNIGGDQLSRDIIRGEGGRSGGGSGGSDSGSNVVSSGPSAQQLRTRQRNDTKLQGQNLITKLNKEFKDKVRQRGFGDRNALLNAQKELRNKTAEISGNIKSLNLQIGGASLSDLKTKTFDIVKGTFSKEPKKKQESIKKQIKSPPKVVDVVPKQTGFSGVQQLIKSGQRKFPEREVDSTVKKIGKGALLTTFGVGSSLVSTAEAIVSPIKTTKKSIPGVKALFKFLTRRGTGSSPLAGLGKGLKTDTSFTAGLIGGEFLVGKGLQKAFVKGPSFAGAQLTKLSPKFRSVEEVVGGTKVINVPSKKGGNLQIKIGGTVSELSEPLSTQTKLSGQNVLAVSAQRDLFGVIKKRTIDISKPLPNEDLLSVSTSAQLKKFRTGNLPENKIIELSQKISKETSGGANILETSFFADPRGRLRPSRLGLENNEARLLDILADDITFRKSKPQALFFEDVKVAKFPPALRAIERKLKAGTTLTPAEQSKLLKFQLTPTGEFKPIGFLSKEPEIILAQGEVIRRKSTPAVTVISGRRVPIIRTEIVKDAKLSKLLKKASQGDATKTELDILKKGTGIDVSSILSNSKFVSPSGLGLSVSTKVSKVFKSSKVTSSPLESKKISRNLSGKVISKPFSSKVSSPVSKTSPTSPVLRTSSPFSSPTSGSPSFSPISSPISRGSSGTSGSPVRIPPRTRPPIVPPPILRRSSKSVKGKKLLVPPMDFGKAHNVLVKSKGKFRKVNLVPLRKSKAENLGSWLTDKSTSRSYRLIPISKKPLKPKLIVPNNYFSSVRKKFRGKKSKGVSKPLNKFGVRIERARFLIDSSQEKSQLSVARARAKLLDKRKQVVKNKPSRLKSTRLIKRRKK